jgi:sulfoxide reductase heme-binding subunit YedZ
VSSDLSTHVFWITSRAAGICALVLASAAVAAGLALGSKTGPLASRGPQLRGLHEALSLGALAALLIHGGALLFDGYLHPGLDGITIPFAMDYRPVWTALGIVGGYGLAVLSLSYYARKRIGVARWRKLHRFIALFWLLGIVHTLGAGTDAGTAWFLILLAAVVLPPLGMLLVRWGSRASAPAARVPAALG